MKKNFSLFGILILLLTVTWFVQEKRVEREHKESLIAGKLITDEIKSIETKEVAAEKRGEQWWSEEDLLSHNLFRMIEEKLIQITSIKDLEGDPATFFTDPVSVSVNGKKWLIGDLGLDGKSFYVAKEGKISLAYFDGGSQIVSSSEEELEREKLNELKTLLVKKKKSLLETQLFRFYPTLAPVKVKVSSEGGVFYELLLNEAKTVPAPIEGINVYPNLRENFTSVVTQITIKEKIPYSKKLKFKKLSSLVFVPKEGQEISWDLWLKDKNSADSVIVDDVNKQAFLMVGGTLKAFFLQVQDYWDRKVIPPSQFKGFKRLLVTFTQGSKQAEVFIIDREPLDFEAREFKVRPGNMRDLFQLIFNLGTTDQAGRVSQLSKSERQMYLGGENLKIEVMDQELLCVRKQNELILVNLSQGFKAHFFNPYENLRCQFQDVLE